MNDIGICILIAITAFVGGKLHELRTLRRWGWIKDDDDDD